MVANDVEICVIKPGETKMLAKFISTAGSSLKTFRYFEKRELSVLKDHIVTCIVIKDNEAVGYGHLDKSDDIVWLGIAISEKLKGKGLGNKLMDYLILKAKENNILQLQLTVDVDNTQAINLYKKFSFNLAKQLNENTLLMKREI